MAIRKTTAKAERIKYSGASCCGCGKIAGDFPDSEVWIILNELKLYCLPCARKLGIAS